MYRNTGKYNKNQGVNANIIRKSDLDSDQNKIQMCRSMITPTKDIFFLFVVRNVLLSPNFVIFFFSTEIIVI
jgi:hypothetical protein